LCLGERIWKGEGVWNHHWSPQWDRINQGVSWPDHRWCTLGDRQV